jgi:hypothetical protein
LPLFLVSGAPAPACAFAIFLSSQLSAISYQQNPIALLMNQNFT